MTIINQNLSNLDPTPEFISLKTASQLFGYTRDHLGLMIRRGKLRATRLGSYYFTTKAWMEDYVKNYASSNHPKLKSKLSNSLRSDIFERQVKNPFQSKPSVKEKIGEEFQKNLPLDIRTISLKDHHSIVLPIRKLDDYTRKRILRDSES